MLAEGDHSRETQMIVLYRPQMNEEREQVEKFLRQGWSETSQAEYDAIAGLAVRQARLHLWNDPVRTDQD